jgi:hypothetical protein
MTTAASCDVADLGDAWAAALRDPAHPTPAGLRAWNGSDPGVRFGVYRNNVVASLIAALADTFPVTRALVGEAFFATLARGFVRGHPPRSPVLAGYGDALPDFIAGYAPARPLAYLADVARLEFLRVAAFHAADASPLGADDVATRLNQPDRLPASRWPLHPSLQVVVSAHPVVDLWAVHQGDADWGSIDLGKAQCALVGRQGDDVLVLRIARADAALVGELRSGAMLGDAIVRTAAAVADECVDLPGTFAKLLAHGWLIDTTQSDTTRSDTA